MGIAVVSGSASGIGAATRKRLEAGGDKVVGIDIRDAEITADLSTPEGRATAISQALEACNGRIDRLVLSAGLSELHPLHLVVKVNYFGAMALLDGFREALKAGSDPSAVLLCSNSARMTSFEGNPFIEMLLEGDEARACAFIEESKNTFLAYAGGKFALGIAMRRRTPDFGAAGIRLNAIAPGPTKTPLLAEIKEDAVRTAGLEGLPNPLGRYATAEEIAASIAFLLGPDASYVHGVVLYADGGIDAALAPDRF
jgi:NAD(P)-dependent dehydrogenase (short-subunit alcohol dehydrogenase family)